MWRHFERKYLDKAYDWYVFYGWVVTNSLKRITAPKCPEKFQPPKKRGHTSRIVATCGHCGGDLPVFSEVFSEYSPTEILDKYKRFHTVHLPLQYNGEMYYDNRVIVGTEIAQKILIHDVTFTCHSCSTEFNTINFTKVAKVVYLTFM